MNEKDTKRTSKFLSLVLRHEPQKIGIRLDEAGWVDVDVLLDAIARHGRPISRETLDVVVRTNDKKRFSFSEDGRRIRASQGHSVHVDLGHPPADPPEILLHGTPTQFLDAIRRDGLKKMGRHDVHLHEDEATASDVGSRRGRPVLLRIRAGQMARQGHKFFLTPNHVWLTDHVPPEFIEFPEQSEKEACMPGHAQLPGDHDERLRQARLCLDGLAVGPEGIRDDWLAAREPLSIR